MLMTRWMTFLFAFVGVLPFPHFSGERTVRRRADDSEGWAVAITVARADVPRGAWPPARPAAGGRCHALSGKGIILPALSILIALIALIAFPP